MSDLYKNRRAVSSSKAQRGVVLIVGLVMVLLITIVGLSAIRGTGLQEGMAGNMLDRNTAFQSAESAVRVGEARVASNILPSPDCSDGVCEDLEKTGRANSVLFWEKDDWEELAREVDLDFDKVERQPRVIIELLDSDFGSCAAAEGSAIGHASLGVSGQCIPYRITALGYGLDENTQVIVQSAYKRRQ